MYFFHFLNVSLGNWVQLAQWHAKSSACVIKSGNLFMSLATISFLRKMMELFCFKYFYLQKL
jgi:hypothetical protein